MWGKFGLGVACDFMQWTRRTLWGLVELLPVFFRKIFCRGGRERPRNGARDVDIGHRGASNTFNGSLRRRRKGRGAATGVKAWICWKLGAGLTGPAA